jgi:hypothetical protein
MTPLAPEIVGPVSVCSSSVEVKGNIAGATIEILVNGQMVSSHVGANPDGTYPIGTTLTANQVMTARQVSGGQTSADSLPITVQAAPSQLSALTLKSVPHVCGRAILVTGAVPGAKIDVLLGTQQAGSAKASKWWTQIPYDAGGSTQPLTVSQVTCNNLSATQNAPAPIPFPNPLPTPVIQMPLIECQSRVTVRGVADGAYVEIYRNNGAEPEDRFLFGTETEARWIKPLVKNDVIKVRQGYSCKMPAPPLETVSPFASATVQPASALHAPKFLGTLCPGSTFVRLGHLVPGARVVLTQNGTELGETDASDTVCNFPVPPLTGGATLEAHMELCGAKGPTATATVASQPVTPAISVSQPYACASLVEVVVGGAPGDYLAYVTNQDGQQISPYDNLTEAPVNFVPVSPSLVAGEQITMHVQGCGGVWQTYGPTTVLANPPQPVVGTPLWGGYNSCTVTAAAGFPVEVFVNNVIRGSALGEGSLPAVVHLSVTLQVGDQVSCAMIVCGVLQKQTPPVLVQQRPPDPPVLLDPPNGAGPVLVQPALTWKDPLAGQPGAATSFQLLVTAGNVTIINQTVSTTSFVPPTPLAYSTVYKWTVTSVNSGGQASAASPFAFTTEAQPAPALTLVSPLTTSVPGNAFPRNQVFTVTVGVTNTGNATSGSYQVEFTMTTLDGANIAQPQFVSGGPLAPGATTSQSVDVEIYQPNMVTTIRISAILLVNNQQVGQPVWRVG